MHRMTEALNRARLASAFPWLNTFCAGRRAKGPRSAGRIGRKYSVPRPPGSREKKAEMLNNRFDDWWPRWHVPMRMMNARSQEGLAFHLRFMAV